MNITSKHLDRMYSLLEIIQKWSDCPEGRQHACILAIKGKYIVATGYNGSFKACGINTVCNTLSREAMRKACGAVHAEVNACLNLFMDIRHRQDVVAFVTKRPCVACAAKLAEHGVKYAYWRELCAGQIVDKGECAL